MLMHCGAGTDGVVFLVFTNSVLVPFRYIVLPLIKFTDGVNLLSHNNLVFVCVNFRADVTVVVFRKFVGGVPRRLRRTTAVSKYNSVHLFVSVILPLVEAVVIAITIVGIVKA